MRARAPSAAFAITAVVLSLAACSSGSTASPAVRQASAGVCREILAYENNPPSAPPTLAGVVRAADTSGNARLDADFRRVAGDISAPSAAAAGGQSKVHADGQALVADCAAVGVNIGSGAS